MTVKELRAALAKAGVSAPSRALKAELLTLWASVEEEVPKRGRADSDSVRVAVLFFLNLLPVLTRRAGRGGRGRCATSPSCIGTPRWTRNSQAIQGRLSRSSD